MARASRQRPEIKEYILHNVQTNPAHVSAIAARKFGLSRTAIANYMQGLVKDGLLTAEGNTKARKYALKKIVDETFTVEVFRDIPEHHIWRFRVFPLMKN